MRYFLKIFLLFLVFVWLGMMYRAKFGQDALTQTTPDILIVGTDSKTPPYAFIQDRHVVGFTIDLARTLGQRIGKKVLIQQISEEQLIPELSKNSVHLISKENSAQDFDTTLLFTKPYAAPHTEHVFVVSENNRALFTLINTALEEIQEDGTGAALKQKWNIS